MIGLPRNKRQMHHQINLIGNAPQSPLYVHSTWGTFVEWESWQQELQLDIETDIEDYWCTKKLITVQFGQVGDKHGTKHQWVLQWSELDEVQRAHIKTIIEGPKAKLIHNSAFETIILRFYGMHMVNPMCTMLAEKVLNSGLENVGFALTDLTFKYLYMTLDKTEQKTFGDNILTENKVVYAATDVIHLDLIRGFQLPQIEKWKLNTVLELENEACLAFSDITFHGMTMDRNKWRENEELAQPIVDAALVRLNSWLLTDTFKPKAVALGILSDTDTLLINYNAPAQKTELLQLLFPSILSGSIPIVRKYIRDNGATLTFQDIDLLMNFMEKKYDQLTERLVQDHRPHLVENNFLRPALVPAINWNSVHQALPLLTVIAPKLKDLSEESLANVYHGIVDDLAEYKNSLKLITTYGQTFLDKHVEPDGKVRTSFNQIISTGRVSSRTPNMQNIPAKEGEPSIVEPWLIANPTKTANDFATRYRNAFVCEENEVFIDSDYTGQELAIIAHISKDPVWLGAITRGEDLHSVCAELVFGKKWLDAKADGCSYYKLVNGEYNKQKCKCPKHKTMRTAVKTVNFGLAYGMGDTKLSATIKITVPEAKALIAQYFVAFPKIGSTLKFLGDYGVQHGYIQTIAPFFRKRWFPFWAFAKGRIHSHLNGQYDATLGAIDRQSKNQPIQGAGADMVKLAMVLVRRWIYDHDYQDRIHIVAQVHDQLTTICDKELAEMWKEQFDNIMQEAALVLIPSGILKADTQITPFWTK